MDDNPVQVIQGKWIVIENNLGREDGIGTKMPPAETKIKQTMLHPRSKTHYKNQMSCSASNAKQGSSCQGQNREELSAGVNT